ncbi:MAG: GntR family transcriptional regulator [Betaproteobacteria bacterium]
MVATYRASPRSHEAPAAGGPLYREVRHHLMEAIAEGTWKPGEAIPAESELAAHFGVSIGTLRKAIDELVANQVLVRYQGRGTFVTTHNPQRLMFHFFHIVGEDGSKQYPAVKTLEFKSGRVDAATAKLLDIPPAERVFRIRNALSLDGNVVIIDDITLPQTLFPGLTQSVFTGRENTIYHFYQSRFGINVLRTHERLRAVTVPADIAPLLGVNNANPLLRVQRVALTYRDRPVELRISHVNTAVHEYENTFGKAEGLVG